jgi:hypothetical protein
LPVRVGGRPGRVRDAAGHQGRPRTGPPLSDYPCPCCGHIVFPEPPGSLALCPVCEWEDDALQLEFATTAGGANALTLFEAQRAGAPSPPDLARDPSWRPIDLAIDDFDDFHEPGARRAPPDRTRLYYWRASFWRRDLAH